ncbi:hypothetical protein [Dactylosporangium sp. NPDC000521]|uniref:hypothetical protein n=1 Tax=Dactylosporangium sp. NPDC000521 TaxID=3363975 RepID=UPI0036B365C8
MRCSRPAWSWWWRVSPAGSPRGSSTGAPSRGPARSGGPPSRTATARASSAVQRWCWRATAAPLDVDVTAARTLTLSALRTKGTCGDATRPYGAVGDALPHQP